FTSTTCTPESQRRFFLDDEGQLWLGMPPLAEADMDYAHLTCLGVAGGRPRAALCGADRTARWEIFEEPVTSARVIPALPGRAVRLADLSGDGKADLCFTDGTLRCAPGRGDGTFDPPIVIGALAIEPESLVLADVDGDRQPDACGRTPTGLVCGFASNGFAPVPWSSVFARSGGADATDRSLSASDADGDGIAEICGLAPEGLACVKRGTGSITMLRTTWPASDATLWSADLDGDSRTDWCVAQTDGPSCAIDRDRDLTTDGAPWGFALDGVAEASPASASVGVLADIDGDRRADLCTVKGRAIVCARSQGHGFGPQTTFATLPAGGTLTALWLGDLDGDARLDACVEDGAAVTCVRN
ncbi:MAG: VCBS repeat-containing protein, partial [Deltaproteobacteria bacterium]|nr:VCBS repeat-containing protein [Deltaproteobacteria bacterium]